VEELQDRQDEGGRLAGAGLGAGEDIAAGKDQRDRLGLDGSGLGIALVRDHADKFGHKPKVIEGHGDVAPEGPPARPRGPVRALVCGSLISR